MTKEEQYELIERFLAGELTEEELKVFNQQMQSDPEFAQEVRLHRELAEVIADDGVWEFEKKVKSISDEFEKPKSKIVTINGRRKYLIAASLAAVLIISSLFTYRLISGSPTNEQLFAEYFEPYPTYDIQRSDDDSLATRRDVALGKYDRNDFAGALADFELWLQDQPGDVVGRYYSGNCYLKLGKPEKAIESFRFVIDHRNNLYVQQSDWYLVLAFLQKDDTEAAKTALKALTEKPNAFNRSKAQEILKKMNQKR